MFFRETEQNLLLKLEVACREKKSSLGGEVRGRGCEHSTGTKQEFEEWNLVLE